MDKVCAITMDDLPLWSPLRRSEHELDIIVSRSQRQIEISRVPVTGFVNEGLLFSDEGLWNAERRYGWLCEWAGVLDAIGNHTYSHMNLHECGTRDFLDDIVRGETFTRKIAGDKFHTHKRLFRFPFLNSGKTIEQTREVKEFLNDRNYSVVPVTIDSNDWLFARAYDYADLKNDHRSMELIAEGFISYTKLIIEISEAISIQLFSRVIPQIFLLHASLLNAHHFLRLTDAIRNCGYQFVSAREAMDDAIYKEAAKQILLEPEIDWRWYRAMAAQRSTAVDARTPAVPSFVMQFAP